MRKSPESAESQSTGVPEASPEGSTWVPPGHFYSPIADLAELAARADDIFAPNRQLPDIDLQLEQQRHLFATFAVHCRDLTLPEHAVPGRRYYYDNDQFGPGDASIFAAMLLEHRPKRVIEVGSGYSSALLLDMNDAFFSGGIACTFVEPYPDRLNALLTDADKARVKIIPEKIQDVPPSVVDVLEPGDFLFIDSTHVTKAGSDVNHEFFTLLPRLRPGVIIHFHDIFYPFEYPKAWFFNGNRSWNELYLLRAFLMNNARYRILFFNSCFAQWNGYDRGTILDFWKNPGGSFWMRKEA